MASLRSLLQLKKKATKKLSFEPERLPSRIRKVVEEQQEAYGRIFREQIKRELNRQKIFLIRDRDVTDQQKDFLRTFFFERVHPLLDPQFLHNKGEPSFLKNRSIYVVVELLPAVKRRKKKKKEGAKGRTYAVVEIPAAKVGRFVLIPERNDQHYLIFLDDVIRLFVNELFPNFEVLGIYSVKLTRDAGLYIDDDFSGDLLEKIKKALSKRSTGVPSRFLYDYDMPRPLLKLMTDLFGLSEEDHVRGGRYHNFHDLFELPNPLAPQLTYDLQPPLRRTEFEQFESVLESVGVQDQLLYYPYQSYDYVIKFLEEAADHPDVRSIQITLYRVAKHSKVLKELMRAAHHGKLVTVFVELKARFDEESNIQWAEELERSGARVLYSFPRLKVHAKLCLVTMAAASSLKQLAYLSTGNFNEKTSQIYSDYGVFTADERLTEEVRRVFELLSGKKFDGNFHHLLVAPTMMREKFIDLIANEIHNAKVGKRAAITAKMNSLEDPTLIAKLYEASQAGVQIDLIIRGICCLLPGVKGLSENIRAISIVDRYLEHARVYVFHNGGDEKLYLSSADWMIRNMSRRIEVAFPIYDRRLREEIHIMLDLQMRDDTKARIIDRSQQNKYRRSLGDRGVRSQQAIYEYLAERNRRPRPD